MPKFNQVTITLDKPENNIYQVGEPITGLIHQNTKDSRPQVDLLYIFRCRVSSETASKALRIGAQAEDQFDILCHTTTIKVRGVQPFNYVVPSLLPVDHASEDVYSAESPLPGAKITSWTETKVTHAPPSVSVRAGRKKWTISYTIEAGIKGKKDGEFEAGSNTSVEVILATSQNQAPRTADFIHETSQSNLEPDEVRRKLASVPPDPQYPPRIPFNFPGLQFVLVFPIYITISEQAKLGCQWRQLHLPEWPAAATVTIYLRVQITENICYHWGSCEEVSNHKYLASRDHRWTRFCGWYGDKITSDSLASEFQPLPIGKEFQPSFRARLCCSHMLEVHVKIVVKMPSSTIGQNASGRYEYSEEMATYNHSVSRPVIVLDETCGARSIATGYARDSSAALPEYQEEMSPPQYDSHTFENVFVPFGDAPAYRA